MDTTTETDTIIKVYRSYTLDSSCIKCNYTGDGFKVYDEKRTLANPDPVNEIAECPKCQHGVILF